MVWNSRPARIDQLWKPFIRGQLQWSLYWCIYRRASIEIIYRSQVWRPFTVGPLQRTKYWGRKQRTIDPQEAISRRKGDFYLNNLCLTFTSNLHYQYYLIRRVKTTYRISWLGESIDSWTQRLKPTFWSRKVVTLHKYPHPHTSTYKSIKSMSKFGWVYETNCCSSEWCPYHFCRSWGEPTTWLQGMTMQVLRRFHPWFGSKFERMVERL